MRRLAKLPFRAAVAIGLATFTSFESPAQEKAAPQKAAKPAPPKRDAEDLIVNILAGILVEAEQAAQKVARPAAPMMAQPAMRKMAVQEDLIVQQFEQQFAGQFRQLYKSELHFMRLVCQPTKQQYEQIAADGETGLKTATRAFALAMHRPSAGAQSDPRKLIADALARSVQTTLSPGQATRYQKELEQRTAARKRAVLLNLVAKVDRLLVLTPEQRAKLHEILENHWNDSWDQLQMLMYGGQHFPSMPDTEIFALLTENQKTVWRGVPRYGIHFGVDLGMVQGIAIEDEVWDDDRPERKPERIRGKPADESPGTLKPGEKQ